MPSLEQTLLPYDFALLRALAEQIGHELTASNARAAAAELAPALTQPETLELILARLSNLHPLTDAALAALIQNDGRYPAAAFIRKFGDLRPLGPAALAREQPWASPANVTEALYYNALIGRAFMDSDTGPQEYFYIPSDLQSLLPRIETPALSPAQAVAPVEAGADSTQPATSILVDDAVTVLAAIQLHPGRPPPPAELAPHLRLPALDFLIALLTDLNCLSPDHRLNPEQVKPLLQAARAEQLNRLAQAWRHSKTWNDLLHLPGLRPEPGAWRNDPVAARQFILKLCGELPPGEWRSLDSFVGFIHEHHPDFQRPAGDYDSWYIRDAAGGGYLRGFEHWDRIDGALVRFIVTGPLHWLGLADLRPDPAAFRLNSHFTEFMAGTAWNIAEQPARIRCKPDGALIVSRHVNRFDRFQAARIGEWLPPPPERNVPAADYEYRLTGNSLQAAAAQGITAKHILSFLRRACDPLPKHIADAIERWGEHGIEARAKTLTVLKLKESEILERLMRSPRTRRWLGEAIGDRAVEVKDLEKLREAMLELGLAVETDIPSRAK